MEVTDTQLWMLIAGFIVAFALAFGLGANDCANSFGTSVGSKVLTLTNACILASIFETAGAILLGAKVSDTIRKGIIDVGPYNGTEELLMVGNVAALGGSCVWMLTATFFRLPVSGTHSIVGATLGFALVAHGVRGVNWTQLGLIIASWFISPMMSGIVSSVLFILIRRFILNRDNPLEPGLKTLPAFYAVTLAINFFSIFYSGSELLGFNQIPLWAIFILAFGGASLVAIFVRVVIVPWQRAKITDECLALSLSMGSDDSNDSEESQTGILCCRKKKSTFSLANENDRKGRYGKDLQCCSDNPEKAKEAMQDGDMKKSYQMLSPPSYKSAENETPLDATNLQKRTLEDSPSSQAQLILSDGEASQTFAEGEMNEINQEKETPEVDIIEGRAEIVDKPEAAKLFSFLQILTAIFGAFAHGGNDVSNAIGPLVALWVIARDGNVMQTSPTPIWILAYGGVGITIGLWIWGRRVIKTMGEDLTKVTPSSGFCIELGAAMTVLIASNAGIPISTTHCKVGSVVSVGRIRSRANVDWSLLRNIIIAWFVTLPITGGISAALMAGLRELI